MITSHHIVLTRAAREAGVPEGELREAARAAAGANPTAETWFQAFRVRGRQFALSTRLVVEVDHFPHRAPAARLLKPSPGPR